MEGHMLSLGFKEYQKIHRLIGERLKSLEEVAFTWLEEILEEAGKAFGKSDNALLPKTPSAKRQRRRKRSSLSRRKIQLEEEQDDYVAPAEQKNSRSMRQTRKRAPTVEISDDDFEETPVASKSLRTEYEKQEAPVGRRTRAASRAATTSKARNTRTNKTKKKTKSDQPVLNLEESIKCDNNVGVNMMENRVPPLPGTESGVVNTCVTPENSSGPVKTPSTVVQKSDIETPKSAFNTASASSTKARVKSHTPTSHKTCKTHIPNFELMNVKEKVHAYEEIVLISPISNVKNVQVVLNTNINSAGKRTPRQSPVTPKTPATVTRKSVSPKTPEQIVSAKVPNETVLSGNENRLTVPDVTKTIKTPIKDVHEATPTRKSSSRKAKKSRTSLRVSLKRISLKHGKMLPSEEKRLEVHDASKPSRPRTRLRLKKKTKETESSMNSETGDTTSTHADEGLTTDDDKDVEMVDVNEENDVNNKVPRAQDDDDENHADVSDIEIDELEPPRAKTTRTKTRAMLNKNQSQEPVKSSTRTKTRHASKTESAQTGTDSAISSDEKGDGDVEIIAVTNMASTTVSARDSQDGAKSAQSEDLTNDKDSGVGSRAGLLSSSSTEGDRPRVTRSKMRKPPVNRTITVDTDDSDGTFTSPQGTVPRVTRTKTRKRQLESESDGDEGLQSKRSCTETSILAGKDKTPSNTTDEQSSDDCVSPVCPSDKIVRPYPKMAHSLTGSCVKPANLNPGLVRSFIHRNSPAPKPTLKEIQEKKKKELLEKEKKNEERLKKREEEHQRRMEEIRRKREMKMKKVEEIRELNRKKAREQKLELEKKLAEKRQLTNKLKEERMKEEKVKQKLRLQKAEEAIERRKQEEEERQRKLKEQLDAEKAHMEWIQRKKEFEEQERLKKIAEERQKERERQLEIEKERKEEAEKLRLAEEERKKEWQKKKEEREKAQALERAEKERQELEKKKEKELQLKKEMEKVKEQERLRLAEEEKKKEQERKHDEEVRKLVEKHNQSVVEKLTQNSQAKVLPKPNLNKTQTLNDSNCGKNNSYELTPDKVLKPSTFENYDITDLNSGDETDDDEAPRKKIPEWALGQSFKALLIKQLYNPPDLNELFPPMEPPDLNELFVKKRARWNNRTSSAHWTSPIPRTWDSIRK